MALSARLYVDGFSNSNKGFRVIECDFKFSQRLDTNNRPVSEVVLAPINLKIYVENSSDLISWITRSTESKSGKIVFAGMEFGKPVKTIQFFNAILVSYYEKFTEEENTIVSISLVTPKVEVAGVMHLNVWSKERT